jgi:hypothetical protein
MQPSEAATSPVAPEGEVSRRVRVCNLDEEKWDGGFGHGDGANRPSQLLREGNEVSIEFHGWMASRFASSVAALQVSTQPKR